MPFIEHIPPAGNPKKCKSAEHNPPTYILLPPGIHTYECPVCGEQQKIEMPEIMMSSNL